MTTTERWDVRRRWLPRDPEWPGLGFARWQARWRTRSSSGNEGAGAEGAADAVFQGAFEGGLLGLLVALLVVVTFFMLWIFVLPALVLLLDLLFLLVVAAIAAAIRVLFKRPWIVRARDGEGARTWAVVGFRRSGQVVEALDAQHRLGRRVAERDATVIADPGSRIVEITRPTREVGA